MSTFLTQNFAKSATPRWADITPLDLTGLTVKAVLLDQRPNARRGWILAYDSIGNVSIVFSTADAYNQAPDWTASQPMAGEYTIIRQLPGGLAIYSPVTTGAFETTYDFTLNDQGGIPNTDPQLRAVYVEGIGWHKSPDRNDRVTFELPIPEATVTSVAYFLSNCTLVTNVGIFIGASSSYVACSGGQATYTTTVANVTAIGVDVVMDSSVDPYVTAVTVEGTTATGAIARFSTTNGTTWGNAVTVGDTPGSVGGCDVSRTSPYSWAAADETVMRATTLGGAYSADANGDFTGAQPRCIVWPYYTRNSTTTRNATQYIVGLSAAIAGDSVFWVTTSQVDITPTVSGNPGLATFANCITVWKGTKMAALLSFGGTIRLVTSLNGGTSWTDRGSSLASQSLANARFIRGRRGDLVGRQLWIALTNGKVLYSKDWGVNWVAKSSPSGSMAGVFDVLG